MIWNRDKAQYMTIMSSKIPEILLRNAVTMFVDDEYVNIRRNKEQQQIQSCVEYTQQNKFSRSKSLKESFKITFKRSSIITRSFTRSKSSECASEGKWWCVNLVVNGEIVIVCFSCDSIRWETKRTRSEGCVGVPAQRRCKI